MFATLTGAWPARPPGTATDDPIADALADQAEAGLDPIVDGLGPRDATDATAVVDAWRAAAAASPGPLVKAGLVGPWAAAERSGADPLELAERTRAAIAALAEAGCRMVEIDEPSAWSIADPASAARFRDAHLRVTDGAPTHCSLVLTGGSADRLGPAAVFDPGYASYHVDLIAGPDNWRLVAEAPGDRGIVCGALDPAASSGDRPELLVWAVHYAASTGGRGLVRVGLANASSLGGLSHERAVRKAEALVRAAGIADATSVEEMAKQLDPRAIDSRTAAYGRVVPKPARRPTRRRPPGSAPS